MNLLVFEYCTASNIQDEAIIFEAVAILEAFCFDLSDISNNNSNNNNSNNNNNTLNTHINPNNNNNNNNKINANILISKDFKAIFDNISKFKLSNNNGVLSFINIQESLESWLNTNVANFDAVLFVAPENDMVLYNITKLIEDKGVKVLGSNSESVLTCSNKFKTFNALNGIVNQPISAKISVNSVNNLNNINNLNNLNNNCNTNSYFDFKTIGLINSNNSINFIKLINSISHNNSNNIIIKPVYGVDCENVTLISSTNDLNNYFGTYFSNINNDFNDDSEFLIQEFVTGDSFSVSLIVLNGKAVPISLNKQFIEFNNVTGNYSYLGGEITHNHPFEEIAFNVAKSAVDAIDGLNGFVGVDLIINNDNCDECFNNIDKSDVYVIEINSRFTTPYVGLRNALNFNIIDVIITENDINNLDNNSNNSNNDNINSNNNILINTKIKVNFKKDINNNDLKIDFISIYCNDFNNNMGNSRDNNKN